MYPHYSLSPALPHGTLYVLLALSRGELYAYDIGAVAHNDSLGSVVMPGGRLYPLLTKMINSGLIETAGHHPVGLSGKERLHYRITPTGKSA